MNIVQYYKKWFLWSAIIVTAIVAVCGLLFGRIVEANVWEEIAKWVVMDIGIVCIVWVFVYSLAGVFYHRGNKNNE